MLITTDAVGGVWQYSLDLAASLARRGAHVLLASLGPRPSPEQRQTALRTPRLTLAESDFALEWTAEPWAGVDAGGEWLLSLQAEFQADVIHLNCYAQAALAWGKPVIVVAHSCVYSWWQAVHGFAAGAEWIEYRRRVTAGLAAADCIVAPSSYMASELQRIYGAPSEKIQVIHNFSSARSTAENLRQPFILAAGRIWDRAKNVALLNCLAPKLDWEIRVAGSNSGPGTSAQNFNLVSLGALPHGELMGQMAKAAVFAHPALYEPFGLSVLEAARSRCCLVLSDIESMRELWGDAAILIDPRDADRWVFELNALAREPTKVEEFGRRARERSRRYGYARAINRYSKLYESLIRSARKTGREAAA